MMSDLNDIKNVAVPEGYKKIKMYDEKTKKTISYFVPIEEDISLYSKIFDLKNNEFPFFNTLSQKSLTC